ncbi:MAG: hypothetical protein PHU08_01190 [Dehalococcoidales bacterium]|nr:hypothetical protein [Dehalococcoidales bacterium]
MACATVGQYTSEAVPEHIKVDSVIEAIRSIPGIGDLHDIHIWTITSGIYAFSAHLIIADQMVSHSAEIMEVVRQRLARQFNITHTTLQVECERCESCPGGLVCQMSRPEEKSDQVE